MTTDQTSITNFINFVLTTGGKGANQAAAAARAGCHTYFVGQVGKDANAPVLREALAGAGVDLTHMREVEGPTGTALILLQPGGENSIIIVGGANQSGWEVSESAKQLLATAGVFAASLCSRFGCGHRNVGLRGPYVIVWKPSHRGFGQKARERHIARTTTLGV